MAAIDTIGGVATIGAGPVWTAVTTASGDSLTVRDFPDNANAWLYAMVVKGPHADAIRVWSPRLHDNVTGINVRNGEAVSTRTLSHRCPQMLYRADTLIEELNGTAADVNGGSLHVYYESLPGASARLASWGDISGIIKSVKAFEVAVTNSGTAGTWTDTVVTTTENQFHADADYAVLGFGTDVANLAIGVKGQETGNLRICGPGTIVALDTSDYFIKLSDELSKPAIPVWNANNRASFYVSTIDNVASSTPTVTLVCAELSQTAPV